MNKVEVVKNLIDIPRRFALLNRSLAVLIKESGFLELSEEVSIDDVVGVLRSYPNVTDEWIIWSQSKKTTGWFFVESDRTYTVGYFPVDADKITFIDSDVFRACAVFIMNEVNEVISNF